MMAFTISGPLVHTEMAPPSHLEITVEQGKITENASDAHEVLHFPFSYHLVPGFIDMHFHGTHGAGVMDADEKSLETISESLAKEGTTSFLGTTMTDGIEKIKDATRAIFDFMGNEPGAEVLGVHLEGPFVSEEKSGAQKKNFILGCDVALFEELQAASGGIIRMVTIAPEEDPDFHLIQHLKKAGVIASGGHSNASFEMSLAAIDAGLSHATHLFNAMSQVHHRMPGIATAFLLSENTFAEIITDGKHVHPAMIQLAYRMKGKEHLVLITDAMRAKCMPEGFYNFAGQRVSLVKGACRLDNGRLAGSVLSMNQAMKNMMHFTDASLDDVLIMGAANPAKELGIFDRKGSIAPGKDADLVILDENYDVVMTICRGEIVYDRACEKAGPKA